LVTERIIRRLNAQHITTDKLDATTRDVIGEYARFRLPYIWDTGKAAIADGTQGINSPMWHIFYRILILSQIWVYPLDSQRTQIFKGRLIVPIRLSRLTNCLPKR
jgi:hypothetical protein